MAKKSFYIIDGHAHIYRAYFAPFRDLSSPSGEPVKATYVFTQLLLNLVQQRKPDYLAMVIDSGDETVFRKKIDPQYKANRQARPEDFAPQERRILQLVRDAGVPMFVAPGFEADDLIATMARRLRDQDFDIYLVSKDKDLRQLLNDCTRLYDVQSDEVFDAEAMRKKLGYGPEQAVEVQTLMGDSTDNVQGIPGVGEKTAAKLVLKYGTVDRIYEHLDELTPKLRENFVQHAEKLKISRQLVTLKNDVEMAFDPQACRYQGLDDAALRRHLRELGFDSLLRRLGDAPEADRPPAATPLPMRPAVPNIEQGLFGPMDPAAQTGEPAPQTRPAPSTCADCDYRLVDTEEKLAALVEALRRQKKIAFDTETDALGAMSAGLIGMSFSFLPGSGCYVPLRGPAGSTHLPMARVLDALAPILADASIGKVGHNLKYDLLVLRRAGVELRGVVMDTMVAAFLIDSSRFTFGIDRLALDVLNFKKIPTADLIGSGRNQIGMDRIPLERVATYAAEDADITWRLSEHLSPKLDEIPELRKLHDELETPLIEVLAEMEFHGVAIDSDVLRGQSEAMSQDIDELKAKILRSADCDFNPDSPKQLADVLFNRLKLKPGKRTKTGFSTDVQVLERLALDHECPRLILAYRSLVKLKNTYLDALPGFVNPRTHRVHTNFNQTGAATGRLSSSDPNLQNIPIRSDQGRRIRLAFVPDDPAVNVLLTADYSQIELRILAHFTREPALVRAFDQDQDIHRAVAAEVFKVSPDDVTREQRGHAKTINFGIIYGVTAFGLAQRIEGMTTAVAQELIDAYNKRFPGIKLFMDQCVQAAQADGYVRTILGRRRPITEINSRIVAMRNAAERMAINSVVQGSAADLIKRAMLDVHRRIRRDPLRSRMLIQVHDELVFETPRERVEEESRIIQEEMIRAGAELGVSIPLKVDVGWGGNWEEGK